MSAISAPGSQMGNFPPSRAIPHTTTDVFVKKADTAATSGSSPSSKVELSDRAKALMAKAEQERAVASQLAAHLAGGGRNAAAMIPASMNPLAMTQWADSGAPSKQSASGQASDGIAAVKEWAKSDVFRNAAKAVADDQVRSLVRDGQLSQLPALDDDQLNQLSEAERNIYGTVRSLQGLYDGMPKTMDQALADRKKLVLEAYPDEISRMRSGLASGSLKKEDGWEDIIASREAELAAAQQGTMKIHAVNDSNLVQSKSEFTVTHDSNGWSARGITVNGNASALQEAFGTKNMQVGSSPYTGDYVITW
ncbi:hypothetical protein [Azospirillum brasilense]|uniref:Uncharacterized protein n=1 Tax=Azospirillum brasilense TaxID=192 RepID=A0A6L3AXV8_AZOBR|nr:hypothetical protein [Azospirillum brasilense]KAA0683161.1 hypothetical protein DS837_19305 [Azospirillum brasilense]